MVVFIPQANQQRRDAFDSLVAAEHAMLDQPYVQASLPAGMHKMLSERVEGAFLPNVDAHGTVRLPAEQRDTNNVAVIPKIAADDAHGGLRLAGSMLEATPNHLQKMSEASGFSLEETRLRLAHRGFHLAQDAYVLGSPVHKGMTGLYASGVEGEPTFVARPHTIIPERTIQSPDSIKAAVSLHEKVHADDIMQLDTVLPDMNQWHTSSEEAGAMVSVICLEAAGVATDDEFIRVHGMRTMLELERQRRRLNTYANPFDPKPQLQRLILPQQRQFDPVPSLPGVVTGK